MQATYLTTKARYLATAAGLSLLLNSGLAQAVSPNAPDNSKPKDEIVELSPFVVDASRDVGYHATNTLAGSRINTDLRDLAGPISVVTKQFMDDIGAVSANDVLTYMVGAEGTRDFQSNTPQLGRTSDNAAADPNASTRGRGLAAFDVTRDYFYSLSQQPLSTLSNGTSVGFDAYNIDGITINRGPNSILAGLGSPAGIINYSPQQALLGKNSTVLTYRFGSYSDQRATLNTNFSNPDSNLAIRVAGAWNDRGFRQQPSWSNDKRWYLAGTYKPFKKTTIHVSFEDVNVHQSLPNTYTPEDDISPWLAHGQPFSPAVGVTAPGLSGAVNGGINSYYNSDGSLFKAYNNSTQFAYRPPNPPGVGIYSTPRFNNNLYGAWDKLNISGSEQHNGLRTIEASIDQEILPNLNLNGAYVHELLKSDQLALGRPDYVAYLVDVNKQLPWGAANPHFGETYMYFAGLDNKQTTDSSNTVARLTATYDLDLTKRNKWFGRYVLTGFLEHRKTEQDFHDFNVAATGNGATVGGGPGVFTYLGGTAANGYRATTVPTRPELAVDRPFTKPDGSLTTLTEIYQLKENDKNLVKLKTSALVLQAYLFDGLVVPTLGIRRDSNDAVFSSNAKADPVSGLINEAGPYGTPANVSKQTKTYGVVVHGPEKGFVNLKWLSVFYNHSENFVPNAGSVDLLGNATPNPNGVSKDFGVSFDLFKGKLNAKIDWYTTTASNEAAPTVNFPLVQWSLPFILLQNNNANGIGAIADIAKKAGVANYDSGLAPGITTGSGALANAYTQNSVAKGVEFELTYNVTKNWRIYGTVTKQESVASGIAKPLTDFINGRVAYWKKIGIWDSPITTNQDWSGAPETVQQVYANDVLKDFVGYQSSEGKPAQQLHKYKASLVTNYSFTDGPIKGFNVGTGLRYLDKTIIGNPAIYDSTGTVVALDLAHPYTNSADINVDAWIGYTRKIHKNYVLSFQLRCQNLQQGNSYYKPVNSNSDGAHQLYTIIQPRTFYFSTQLEF